MYIDFNTYKSYGGTITDSTLFNKYNNRCTIEIDNATFNRLKDMELTESEIEILKRLSVEYIDLIANNENTSQKAVSSESVQGWSVSYDTSKISNDGVKTSKANLIKTYLNNMKDKNGVPVLFCGGC